MSKMRTTPLLNPQASTCLIIIIIIVILTVINIRPDNKGRPAPTRTPPPAWH